MSVLDIFGREGVEFVVRGPIPVYFDAGSESLTGCSYLDISFAKPSKVGEIVFKNYYTAHISILAQHQTDPDTPSPWAISIEKKILMTNPHFENGSHDVFSISATESAVSWENLTSMRIFLRQPSPVWSAYRIEEINIFSALPRLTSKNVGEAEHNKPKVDKLLDWLKKQTIAALNWSPKEMNRACPPNSSTANSRDLEKSAYPYDIIKLPQA